MGRMVSVKLEYDDRDLQRNIKNYTKKSDDIVSAVFEYNAPYATAWMKTNAPWHDNTGAARASLFAVANNRGKTHELLLSHGVHYGIWLEVAHNRRWQILASAQRYMGTKIMHDLQIAFRSQ